MKPGPAISTEATSAASSFDAIGQPARADLSRRLGEHHRGIACEIPWRRIARRLDRYGATVQSFGDCTLGLKGIEHSVEERGIACVKAQFSNRFVESEASSAAEARRHGRRLTEECIPK